jgi:L,D-transpeptidase ErfK/SrfK
MKILLIILSIAINYNIHSFELIDLIGYDKYYKTKKDETLIDIARANNLAFPEIMSANQGLDDPWVVEPEKNLLLPQRHLLPRAKREGVIVNKGDLRLYYFSKENKVYSFPIGIGRGDWETPTGKARITGKKKNPYWTVPASILEEEPHWPKVVKPGPENPLGSRAIYLSMPGYLLHGTNKPWGVGMKVSHGCIRLYPEDIEMLYELVSQGENVEIIDQPVKSGWFGGVLYLEVHSMHPYGLEDKEILESNMRLLPLATKSLQDSAKHHVVNIDWKKVVNIVKKASGVPEAILTKYKN